MTFDFLHCRDDSNQVLDLHGGLCTRATRHPRMCRMCRSSIVYPNIAGQLLVVRSRRPLEDSGLDGAAVATTHDVNTATRMRKLCECQLRMHTEVHVIFPACGIGKCTTAAGI